MISELCMQDQGLASGEGTFDERSDTLDGVHVDLANSSLNP